ncbi:dual specificity protein phosphatase 16-like [Paramacrobiotus metropolitanus]|uniref:dual specificity protein phosphatase 16-like n=1 Tax=Paramacrobiotus metropolitanus TaxID=2943436 RepID=UPI0024464FE9|nr:dual specificity protein phosphatase 16-like [Paramacrobiotus metropolitanus]XP_055329583.1 dual specificity protein phosphatase 16-like [Paramacrobiotus metropolitanus]
MEAVSLPSRVVAIAPNHLARLLEDAKYSDSIIIVDGRNLLDHKIAHIRNAHHLPNALLMRRRLEQNKIPICEYLRLPDGLESRIDQVIVYDAASADVEELMRDNFLAHVVQKLDKVFRAVSVLRGGYTSFSSLHPSLCRKEMPEPVPSISQPSMALLSEDGPTKIFPYLFLGSERDALSRDVITSKEITYVLNVSMTCGKADFIKESNFMRIPVNDTFSEKLLGYFVQAFEFLDRVKNSNGRVLVHCMAGVSRSPTLAIAYVMYSQKMTYDEAYRYVKEKRPSISPNFNFLGQLLEFDRTLKKQHPGSDLSSSLKKELLHDSSKKHSAVGNGISDQSCKRQRLLGSAATQTPRLNIDLAAGNRFKCCDDQRDLSPSSALARISLNTSTKTEA